MINFNFFKKKSFGIDLGNNNTLVSNEEKVLWAQPSYIVFNSSNNEIKAVGHDAFEMFEKTHSDLKSVKPLRGGVIADHTSAVKMVSALVEQACGANSFLNGYERIVAGVPYYTTDVEKRALLNVLEPFRASSVSLLYEPLAAAIGMGLNIQEPDGKMVVDIGGGITEIVVISLSGIASFQSVKVAGDTLDEEIQHYFRRQYNIAIGLKTAEQVKIQIGSVLEKLDSPPEPMMVKGKDLMKGIPVTRIIGHAEIARVLDKSFSAIELAMQQTLEKCSAELAGDIYGNGIIITGGNAYLRGLKERLESKLRLKIHIDHKALTSVSDGVGMALRDRKKYRAVLINR